eukprot:1155903-Pelagomonas_calceolata.AAC.3
MKARDQKRKVHVERLARDEVKQSSNVGPPAPSQTRPTISGSTQNERREAAVHSKGQAGSIPMRHAQALSSKPLHHLGANT